MVLSVILFTALLTAPCNNCVAFRLDDIQDYYDNEGQTEVIKMFREQNATLTIGVIGSAIGNDGKLVAFLQENRDILEFANHGWLHEDFSILPTEEQSRLMNKTSGKIRELFGVKPVTFITPFNRLNEGTSDAASQNGMFVISADRKRDSPTLEEGLIYHLPVNANVSDYDEEKLYWKSFGSDVVLADVRKGIERDGYAMIMMHPRDFVEEGKVDPAKIEELGKLIPQLRMEGIQIVTVQEIAGIQRVPEFNSPAVVAGLSLAAAIYAAKRYWRRLP